MDSSKNTTPALPSAEEMQHMLRQSGVLDRTTVFPDKTTPGMESVASLEQVELAHAQSGKAGSIQANIEFSWVKRYIPKIVGILLTIQSLRGIYKSIYFTLVEFPELEIALANHLITNQQINNFAARAAVTAISTVISMIFAMRLTIMKTKAAKIISTLIGIGLLLANTFIQQYFSELNSGVIFSDATATFLEQTVDTVDSLLP